MKIQLALDRFTIQEAIEIAAKAEKAIEWIEVGTSLIKEFGVKSIYDIKNRFPDKTVVADIKTFDNAKYEFELCFRAGADIATVMGAAPPVTLRTCLDTAGQFDRQVMVDLLNTAAHQQKEIARLENIIVCQHISKDQQEEGGGGTWGRRAASRNQQLAVAGGISLENLAAVRALQPDVLIIGSAISKASDPLLAAQKIKEAWEALK
ncbi:MULTISPECIES: 3-hexulose-6-phosphate synthase [Heyndrickxia]|jgi:3-hexulose-6-phosphate synthase|uniref:3-hexulose-6-phosphate synthase n=2 Tax=Heyndrickxia coagulans TaxID=1398 RepID=G2TRB0_HEYCO|nr:MULTISPECIES: 3-hexulose-6-phosphate synthase [Heyndrickxia]AEP00186.1 Orotidine 5'-phosphate decarboxylase [Heyndrickxia coagulans 36D1]APB38120.1 3-hexulose-6-phosphate synthase [Heyndrickxia coagulans]AVD54976.1 3-hexulose-6-phosphate synthase [Heyndrickxia coagulans]AWP35854.1 3-hexulose-6-phosphate synthase [Heyndrickxia coagulans]MED4919749.1 orotidine 5'-phosphate decarboxylase [Weizmannia sp. CD-2023]